MPAHILLERAELRPGRHGDAFAVHWSLVNAGDQVARVSGWCVWCAAADPATLRADRPPRAGAGSVFSEGAVRLQPGQRLERTDASGALGWCEPAPAAPPCFTASVEYTDDTGAARRMHAVLPLLAEGGTPQHCHFASLRP
jgi:hypothetical protein